MQRTFLARTFLLPLALIASDSGLRAQDPGETWQLQSTLGNPEPRADYMAAFFGAGGTTILFGGQTLANGLALGETWSWDGDNWSQVITQGAPAPRSRAAMAYDPLRGRIVLFGGVNETGGPNGTPRLFGDTWEFDGLRWAQVISSTSPPALVGAAMAWDPVAEKLLLYGGGTTFKANLTSDTWNFDGSDWVKLSPGQNPGTLKDHRMVTDTKRKRIVLFGGIDGEVVNVSITASDLVGEWDSGNWIFQNRTSKPSARRSFGMAYDSIRNLTVVTYGVSARGTKKSADTWKWNGSVWDNNIFLDPKPQARGRLQLVENPNTGRMMLYGGEVAQASPGHTVETWEFFGPAIAEASPFGSGCPGTNGLVPRIRRRLGENSRPRHGQDFRVFLSGLPDAPGPSIGILGFSNTIWRDTGFALPDDLGWIGMPGCKLLVSFDRAVALAATGGVSEDWVLRVPADPSFIGFEFFLQGLAIDPGTNTIGVTLSNGLAGVIGSQ